MLPEARPRLAPTSSHVCQIAMVNRTILMCLSSNGLIIPFHDTDQNATQSSLFINLMSNFSSLPLELVIYIIQSAEYVTDLRALCTVSKTISAVAQPLLYHEIDFEDCDSIAGWIECLRIDAVTRCGCDHFSLELYGQIPRWNPEGKYSPYEEEVNNFSIAVDRLKEIYDVAEFLTASNSKPNVLVALLVSCTTNLTELTVHVDRNSLALLSALGQPPSTKSSCLSKIESLCLKSSTESAPNDEMSFDSIIPLLLLLAKLNTVWISGCLGASKNKLDNFRSNRLSKILLPQSLPITRLSFAESCLTASNLRLLVSACKDLKVFSFTNPGKSQQPGRQFSPTDLYSALDCQKSNLEDLRVTLETDSVSQAFGWDGCTYGSFRECTRMRFLQVDERFLGFPPAGFPDSLEYLVIHNCQACIFDLLSYLAALITTGTELISLKTISVHAHILFPGGMLGLPLKGATDLLFKKAQEDYLALFLGTEVTLQFESGLLEKTILGYEVASEDGFIGDYGPFAYTEQPKTTSDI